MERIESSETSVLKDQTPGDYPLPPQKNTIRLSTHGEILKSNVALEKMKINGLTLWLVLSGDLEDRNKERQGKLG